MLFPSAHFNSEQVAENQPVSLGAMEGLFQSERQAGIVLTGRPDVENQSIENPIVVRGVLRVRSASGKRPVGQRGAAGRGGRKLPLYRNRRGLSETLFGRFQNRRSRKFSAKPRNLGMRPPVRNVIIVA